MVKITINKVLPILQAVLNQMAITLSLPIKNKIIKIPLKNLMRIRNSSSQQLSQNPKKMHPKQAKSNQKLLRIRQSQKNRKKNLLIKRVKEKLERMIPKTKEENLLDKVLIRGREKMMIKRVDNLHLPKNNSINNKS